MDLHLHNIKGMLRLSLCAAVGSLVAAVDDRRLDAAVMLTMTSKPDIKIFATGSVGDFANIKLYAVAEYKDTGTKKSEHSISNVCNEDDVKYTAAVDTTLGVAVKRTDWTLVMKFGGKASCSEASGSGSGSGSIPKTDGTIQFSAIQPQANGQLSFMNRTGDVKTGQTAFAVTFTNWPFCADNYVVGFTTPLTGPLGALRATKSAKCGSGDCFLYWAEVGGSNLTLEFDPKTTNDALATVTIDSTGNLFTKIANFGSASTAGYVILVSMNPSVAWVSGTMSFTTSPEKTDICSNTTAAAECKMGMAAATGVSLDMISLTTCKVVGTKVTVGFQLQVLKTGVKTLWTKVSGLSADAVASALNTAFNNVTKVTTSAVTVQVDALPSEAAAVSEGKRGAPATVLLLSWATLVAALLWAR